MDEITYAPLTRENFTPLSLEKFVRRQQVRQCWRREQGALVLRPVEYVENWSVAQRQGIAAEVLATVNTGGAAFGAFAQDEVAGFAALSGKPLGSRGQYADLTLFYVTEPLRCRGIGGTLFRMACDAARERGAEKLYISAHSAADVMAAYWALGCVEAEEPDPAHSAAEPYDVQLERPL